MPIKPPPDLQPLERSFFGKIAEWTLALWERIQRAWIRFAELNQHSPWFPVLIMVLVAFDAVVVILPGDLVVALAVLSNPKAWKRLALYGGVGNALGAFALYLLIQHFGKAPLDQMTAQGLDLPHWGAARGFFNKYGLFSLALGSVLPFLAWPPVVMAGLSTDRWGAVLGYLLLGRIVRFFGVAFGVREGWAMFQAVRIEAREKRGKATGLAEGAHERRRRHRGPPDRG